MSDIKDGKNHPNMNFENEVYRTVALYGMAPIDRTLPSPFDIPQIDPEKFNPIISPPNFITIDPPKTNQSTLDNLIENLNNLKSCNSKDKNYSLYLKMSFLLMQKLLKENNFTDEQIKELENAGKVIGII